jgi:hypothetical protein
MTLSASMPTQSNCDFDPVPLDPKSRNFFILGDQSYKRLWYEYDSHAMSLGLAKPYITAVVRCKPSDKLVPALSQGPVNASLILESGSAVTGYNLLLDDRVLLAANGTVAAFTLRGDFGSVRI